MLNVNELQIVDDFLTAVAPKLNDNANLNEPEMLLSISAITPGAIPTGETSPVEVSEGTLTGQLLYDYMKAIELMPRVTMDVKLEKTLALLSMLRPVPRKVLKSVAKATAWVAPQGVVAASGNLIARVDYALVAGSTFAGIQACLRVKDVEGGMLPTVEVNAKQLLSHSRRGFKNIGPYVEVTIEANSKIGQIRAHELMGEGIVIGDLKGTAWENVRWVMSAVEDRKGKITLIMTPGRMIKNLWALAGYACKGNPKTILKRLRRSMTDGKYEFLGTLAHVQESTYFLELGDGIMHELPCKDAVYLIHSVIIDGILFKFNAPREFVAGHVHMTDDKLYAQLISLVDGSHGMSPKHINRLLWAADPKLPGYEDGDGCAVTFDHEAGHVKGHGCFHYCGHRGMVIYDSKTEAMKIDGEIRLVIDRDLHRPRVARTDPQSFNNFRYGRIGILSEFGKAYIAQCSDAIGDSDKLNAMFEGLSSTTDFVDTLDEVELLEAQRLDPKAKLPVSKSAWSLAANMALAKSTFIAVASNGDAQRVDMNNADGTKMNMWANPRMANRGRRHLMETVLQLSKGRIPIAADKALRAYAMCDITIFSHPDQKYDGLGVYLSQGVLKAQQAVVFNVVLDEEGNPITRKEIVRVKNMDPVTGFEYYTNVEKTHVVYEMVQGPACCHRQPNGWAGEIERFLELVDHARYARMAKSPFIFFSCERMHVVGELKELLLNLIGARMLTKITDLWGDSVPFIVILNAILGGGDLDDLMMVYTYDKLVNFLRSPEELAFVAAYPNENIVLDANVTVANVAPTSHQARMDAKRKAAAQSDEFGPAAWYRVLKLMKASGLVAELSNTLLIWAERLNEGDPIPVNMGGYGRNLEGSIDAEMKTGEDVAGVSKRCDECNAAVVRVSKFFERRLPWAIKQEGVYQVVEGTIDRELAVIQTDLDEFNAAFANVYLNPNNVQIMDYMQAFTPGIKVEEIASAWRGHYNTVRTAVKAQREEWLSDPNFDTVDADEKSRFAIANSVREGDSQSFKQVVNTLWNTDRVLVYKAVIAMAQSIQTMKITRRKADGSLEDRPDALLYAEKCNTVLREAMRYARVSALFPQAIEIAAQVGTLAPALTIPGLSLMVLNGMEKRGAHERERFITTATQHARVSMHYLDVNVENDMVELWTACPALRGRKMDAVAIYHGTEHFGFVKKEQIALFRNMHGKRAIGTLARAVDSRTGAYNLYSAQVVINAA
jgi:hypothetical protein